MPASSVMNPFSAPQYPPPPSGSPPRKPRPRRGFTILFRLILVLVLVLGVVIGGVSLLYTGGRFSWIWLQHNVLIPDPFVALPQERPVRFSDRHGGLRVLDPAQLLNWKQVHEASDQLDTLNDKLQADGWVLLVPKVRTFVLHKEHVDELFTRWNLGAHGMGGRGFVLVLSKNPDTVELWTGRGFCSALPQYNQPVCQGQGIAHRSSRLDDEMLKQVISHHGMGDALSLALNALEQSYSRDFL